MKKWSDIFKERLGNDYHENELAKAICDYLDDSQDQCKKEIEDDIEVITNCFEDFVLYMIYKD